MSSPYRPNADRASALTDAFGATCKECGAALRSEDQRCESCGALFDADQLGLLRAHRDLLRRTHQRLRTTEAVRLLYGDPELGLWRAGRIRWLGSVLAFAISALAVWLVYRLAPDLHAGIYLFGVILLALPGLEIARRAAAGSLERTLRAKRLESRDQLAVFELTTPVRCSSCGGFASTLDFQREALPCPWCESELLPPEHARGAQRGQMARHFRAETRRAERAMESGPGGARGALVELSPDLGAHRVKNRAIWTARDVVSSTTFYRMEISAPTRSELGHLVVHGDVEERVREAAATWELALPDTLCHSERTGWRIYSNVDEPLRILDLLLVPVYGLQQNQCLMLDRAGASLWQAGGDLSVFDDLLGVSLTDPADEEGATQSQLDAWFEGNGERLESILTLLADINRLRTDGS